MKIKYRNLYPKMCGAFNMLSVPEEWKKKYTSEAFTRIYYFKPPINRDNFLKKIPVPNPRTIDILANLEPDRNVLLLAALMKNLYPNMTPEEVLNVLEQLRIRGYLEIKGESSQMEVSVKKLTKIAVCPECKVAIAVDVKLEDLDFSKGKATISYIHGDPPHMLLIYISPEGEIIGTQVIKDVKKV